MAAILKICFALLLLKQKADCLEAWQEASEWLVDQNSKSNSDRKFKKAAIAAILKIYFSLFLLNRKANLFGKQVSDTGQSWLFFFFFFLFLHQNICYGYSLLLTRSASSTEYHNVLFCMIVTLPSVIYLKNCVPHSIMHSLLLYILSNG